MTEMFGVHVDCTIQQARILMHCRVPFHCIILDRPMLDYAASGHPRHYGLEFSSSIAEKGILNQVMCGEFYRLESTTM